MDFATAIMIPFVVALLIFMVISGWYMDRLAARIKRLEEEVYYANNYTYE